MTREWLSLSKVAEMLGVHPSTVRNWSDQGVLPTHRTKGGHRRYLRSEVDLWMQAQRSDGPTDARLVAQNALRNTRFQISEGRLKAEPWYQKLDEDAREHYRRSGRSLLQGLIAYLNSDEKAGIVEADALGYEYASRGHSCGLNSVEAVHAFLFFRNVLLESMLDVFEAAAVQSPSVWNDMFRKITTFTDRILVKLLQTYEDYQRVNHR